MGTIHTEKTTMNMYGAGDCNAFIAKVKHRSAGDDTVPWLITFADLMTILLIFSFVLFMAHYKGSRRVVLQDRPPDANTSLVMVAHAKTGADADSFSIPLHAYRDAPPAEQSPEAEAVIMKRAIRLGGEKEILPVQSRDDLTAIARLALKNPSSRIIVHADLYGGSARALDGVMCVVDYLVGTCDVSRKMIFLQAAPDRKRAGSVVSAQPHEKQAPIDIKLVKTFWWF